MAEERKNPFECRESSKIIQIDDTLQELMGERNSNAKVIESLLKVVLSYVDGGLLISGLDTDVELAVDLLEQLSAMMRSGEKFFQSDITRAIKMLSDNRRLRLADVFTDYIKVGGRRQLVAAKTVSQKRYLDAIRGCDVVFGVGPAGTGKTYLAMATGLAALLRKDVKKLVLCRPAVEAGEKLGFLPGDMADKVNPYLRPLYDALYDMVDYEKAQELLECGAIEVAPLAFMRGRTLSNAFVILDEGQNTSKGQMKMFLTRLGFNSKCVVTGDVTQIDLPHGVESGLLNALKVLVDVEGIGVVNFSEVDVIRHPLVARIITAYEKSEKLCI